MTAVSTVCLSSVARLTDQGLPNTRADVAVFAVSVTRYDAAVSSISPTVAIDPSSPIPLHEQVAAAVRRAIAEGEAGPGDRLPPARDLAAALGVNANTVFRGLRTLRDEGLLEFRRGRGVTVSGDGPRRSVVVAKARELVTLARELGYRGDELASIIDEVS